MFKETKDRNWPHVTNGPQNTYSLDYTKWEMVDRIGNVYNRLILYRGDLFHVSLDYFGQNIQDGRLFQTFFFNTEY
jgi:mannosyltransferase OCH1-like enzyme